MQTLDDLAHAIDSASDAGDKALLRRLGGECKDRLGAAEGEERVRLLYYWSNTYSSIISIKRQDSDYIWDWEQPEGVQNNLLLRRAIRERAFETIDPIVARQIRTNLANRLHALGRPVAASKPPRPKGGALTTPTPKIFCYPMKQLAHIRSKVTSQNPFPVLRCPYQRILAIIDCVTGPSESHRMLPESICVSVV